MTPPTDVLMTAKKEAVAKRESGAKKGTHHRSRLHDSFQEEIANTYFKSSSGRRGPKKKRQSTLPWLVAGLAAGVAVAIFISRSNFDIKVRVTSGAPFITKDDSQLSPDGAQYLVKGGEVNRSLVARAYFVGDARASSRISDGDVSLVNSRDQGWASFVIELRSPVDLRRLDIRYAARGQKGTERLVPVVTDSQNRSYRIEDSAVTAVSDNWNAYLIDLKPVKERVDLAGISALKFEFGSETAGNGPASVISMKDISIIKARRLKWL
jgi:hypothetical protein